MSSEAGITAAGVVRSFGSVRAIRAIDFEAPPGEVTALIGPNGSGKTTLMLILASLLAPDAGTVRICGVDPLVDPLAVRRMVGWMPDTLGVWDSLTAREILQTLAACYGLAPPERERRAEELLRLVRLEDLAGQPARVLSRGQQQRLSLARALIHDPQVLLLDEPASGLDPGSRVELRSLLRTLAGLGKTIVVSSHVLVELDAIADRAVFVKRGKSVQTQRLVDAGTQRRTYRICAEPIEPLLEALSRHGFGFTSSAQTRTNEVDVVLDGTAHAAWLLRTLVEADVVVSAFAPAGGALEETYMTLEVGAE